MQLGIMMILVAAVPVGLASLFIPRLSRGFERVELILLICIPLLLIADIAGCTVLAYGA